jgi:predicted alpha/beta hydrolase family esterase
MSSAAQRRFLILHGLGSGRPHGHWQWWLAEQLRQRGEQVLFPQLPTPQAPDLDAWLRLLAAEYDQLGGGQRIVVCHSLSCVLWYQASRRNLLPRPADRVLLVAPPGPSVISWPVTTAFDTGPWQPDPLHASSLAPIRLVASDRDVYCQEGPAAQVYGEPLGLDAETLQDAGHLAMSDGYGPWPGALRWCLDGSTRFSDPGEPGSRPARPAHSPQAPHTPPAPLAGPAAAPPRPPAPAPGPAPGS